MILARFVRLFERSWSRRFRRSEIRAHLSPSTLDQHPGINPDFAIMLEEADRLRDAGNRREAAEAYRAILQLTPERADIRVQYGNMLKDILQLREAEAAYRAALSLQPEQADTYLQLGHALKLQGRRSEAIEAYLQSVALDPFAVAPRHELFHMGHQPTQQQFFQTELLLGVVERFMEVTRKVSDLQNTLDNLIRTLPDLTAYAAIPVGCYDAFRAIYDVPTTSSPDERISFCVILLADNETLENLRAQILSIKAQKYGNWRLHVIGGEAARRRIVEQASANESRVTWINTEEGEHPISAEWRIGTQSDADWLVLLAPAAVLHTQAIAWFASVANRFSADAYVSDEEIDTGSFSAPGRLRPKFRQVVDYDTLLEANVFGETFAIRRSVFGRLPELARAECVSVARSLALLALAGAGKVGHIPCMLVRRYGASSAGAASRHAAHLKAIETHLSTYNLKNTRFGTSGSNFGNLSAHWVKGEKKYRIAVVIPTRDGGRDFQQAVASLRSKASVPQGMEFIIVDNGSRDYATLEILDQLAQEGLNVISLNEPFNWSRLNNEAVRHATAPLLLFVNDDVKMLTEGWDEILRRLLDRPELGAVGARLLYPDDTLQHGGILFGWHGSVIHDGLSASLNEPGPARRWHVSRAVSAVTGAFLGTRRDAFQENGGFDELNLAVSYSDVDYCLRLRRSGLKILWTPQITLYHFESKTRGLDHLDPEKHARNSVERAILERRWGAALAIDPGINPAWHMATMPFRLLSAPSQERLWQHIECCAAANPWALGPGHGWSA